MEKKRKTVLLKDRGAIIEDCFRFIVTLFRKEYADFLIREKDRFLNPVGYTLMDGLGKIYDHIITGDDHQVALGSIESIMKIMVVHRIKPSEAISFLYRMKIDIIKKLIDKKPVVDEILHVGDICDRLTLAAFDSYSACKDKIYDLKFKGNANPHQPKAVIGN